ncbi:hypothetical protein BIY37_06510 [Candidatus Brocadia sapporoensis]|uniref:TRASH domain-containing protein n=1 Tax=Candidatus Brocadia sapporoensis TaxID=392547 RepID=A0A1V6M083_9BACT|nr:YHS domain-containing protein [Candidatus Brocadia sapporoensis]MDG6005098.1 YHS domain-containing protein [Candidatus Brocadia sp.]OQD45775.1 hypothetical protein BIY37_06510 [Candidatus Brocadia sapporoensis]GJQ24623.1 MAG: hypothetical protein HBSAPP01_24130 [Candidatus Brocadia sapporoensis]
MVNRYFLVAVIFLFVITGCAGPVTSSKKGKPRVVDPVCAYFSDMGCVNIEVCENTPKSMYEGVTYYFCSSECKTDFDKNPLKYLKMASSPKGARDPVCHIGIDELERFVPSVYLNKVYYFCSDYCMAKFLTNPDYYMEKE